MKWLAFTGVCVAVLITLGLLAVDERDIVWEGRQAFCPYCRAEMPRLALVCAECRRSVDWTSHQEPCRWCLNRTDVKHMNALFDDLQFESDPLPGALGAFTIAYFRSMDEGACTYCGGLGEVLENGVDVVCPVCRGEKLCVACGGDGAVTVGDEGAHRRELDRRRARDLAEARAEVTGLPLKRALLTDQDVEALMGHAEAETLTDEHGRNLLTRARARVKRAFEALDEARERRGAKTAPGGND
jgi:hypothetical protein